MFVNAAAEKWISDTQQITRQPIIIDYNVKLQTMSITLLDTA